MMNFATIVKECGMTNLEVALAGLILLSLTALLTIIWKRTSRLRFLMFATTCLAYIGFQMWQDPGLVNSRKVVIVFMVVAWALTETFGENAAICEDSGRLRLQLLPKIVAIIFLATSPILLVIVDFERSGFGLAEWIAIAVWSMGALFKGIKNHFDGWNLSRYGTYLMVWAFYIYALGTHDGIFAIFAPLLILGKLVKTPEYFVNQTFSTNV